MKFLLAILFALVSLAPAQLKNSYGKTKWAIKNTTVFVDTTGLLTWKSAGTADTGKAFPWGQTSGQYVLSWKHTSNGDDSGQFALRWYCYDGRIAKWVDTAQYQVSAAFTVTKSVTTLKDTIAGIYNGNMVLCDSLKPIITPAVASNKGDTLFITSLQLRAIYDSQGKGSK